MKIVKLLYHDFHDGSCSVSEEGAEEEDFEEDDDDDDDEDDEPGLKDGKDDGVLSAFRFHFALTLCSIQ